MWHVLHLPCVTPWRPGGLQTAAAAATVEEELEGGAAPESAEAPVRACHRNRVDRCCGLLIWVSGARGLQVLFQLYEAPDGFRGSYEEVSPPMGSAAHTMKSSPPGRCFAKTLLLSLPR